MVHDKTSLVVSQDEATKFENEAKRRLLATKKLSLVVDLDQTVIQACVEPTIGDWKRNPQNPNHDAVKDVREFQLVEDAAGTRGCWYYIKLRPGLEGFLERMSGMYEMHIYTMGTRGYAQKIAQIIDPERKFFGNRILSRDESGSLVAKSLQRLFPVDTKMVLIIDDRGDVWKWNENLIKVTPYDFFVGIGDINSSFLPKKPGLPPAVKASVALQPEAKQLPDQVTAQECKAEDTKPDESSKPSGQQKEDSASMDTSALEQLVSMGSGDDPVTLEEQTHRQDETLAAQLEERPLLKKQLQLEQDENEDHKSQTPNGDVSEGSNSEKPRHHILEDHDQQLKYLEEFLVLVHTKYFEQYSSQLAAQQEGRVAELRGSKRKQPIVDTADLATVPDVKALMPLIKKTVLDGVVIVLSGVVPLGWDIQNSDLAMWAKSFGAKIEEEVTRKTTHLIAARNRTAKVRRALKRGKGKVMIVGPQWLVDSLAQWTKLDETNYLLDVEETETSQGTDRAQEEDEFLSESEDIGSENEDVDELRARSKPALSIKVDDANLDDLVPGELEDQESPLGGTHKDWDDMNDELADFLGSEAGDAEESDGGGSVKSVDSAKSSKSVTVGRSKRLREFDDSEEEGMRKRAAPNRLTNLSQTSLAGKPRPANGHRADEDDVENEAEAERSIQAEGEEVSDDEEGFAELEQSLAAEMEKDAAEEEGEG